MICKNCGGHYSDYLEKCPSCGYNPEIGEKVEIPKTDMIKEQEKWFGFFAVAPKLFSIITAILTVIPSVVFFCLAIFQKSGWSHYNELYGLFGFICMFGGLILSLIIYVCLKLSLSYKILHIEYLKKMVVAKQGCDDNKEIKKI